MALVLGLAQGVDRRRAHPPLGVGRGAARKRHPVGAEEADPGDVGQRVGVVAHLLDRVDPVDRDQLADVPGEPVRREQRVEPALGPAVGPLLGGLGGGRVADPADRAEHRLGVAVDRLEDVGAVRVDQVVGALAADPGDGLQIPAHALDPARVERLRLARGELQPVLAVELVRPGQPRARLLLEVADRPDRDQLAPVVELDDHHRELPVVGAPPLVDDLDLTLELVPRGRPRVEQPLLS